MIELIRQLSEKSARFIDASLEDISRVRVTREILIDTVTLGKPLVFFEEEGETPGCRVIYIEDDSKRRHKVLDIYNYHTFPVSPRLDTASLSQRGQLESALDHKPFMFSGPCPTTIIWAGTMKESDEDTPQLSYEDCSNAFTYWIQHLFGVSINTKSEKVSSE